ncbi:MAG TPA: nuclease-related domain-containing protein, partial [Candidatus Acidoferrum sp.]|nr:nuclease-related domain-containing protein [Candidatus Acidoferrum sp.]
SGADFFQMNENPAENVPGKSTRAMATRRRGVRYLLILASAAVVINLFLVSLNARNVFISFAVLAALFFLDRLVHSELDLLWQRERHAIRGADAEEKVGAILNRLPARNHLALHDVAAEFGNLDHLVFRADGAVFIIETKSHHGRIAEERGELRQDGHPLEKDFLKQVHRNVYWLSHFLKTQCGVKPWIHAAIVFPNAYVSVRRTLRGVDILNVKYLERWMAKAHGNPQAARKLWPQMDRLKPALQAGNSIPPAIPEPGRLSTTVLESLCNQTGENASHFSAQSSLEHQPGRL